MLYKLIQFLLVFLLDSARCSMVVDMYSQSEGLYLHNYCPSMKYCREGSHVMCMYYDPKHPMGPRCINSYNITITPELANQLLDVTNAIRSKIATGKETGKDAKLLPRGYGIFRLKWDSELATFAQVLANQCVLRHDLCRATERFPDPGQTTGLVRFTIPDWLPLSRSPGTSTPGLTKSKLAYAITQSLKSWYAQKASVTEQMIKVYPDWGLAPNQAGQLYLEMIFGGATHMGCGMSAYTEYSYNDNARRLAYNSIQVVCNYSARPRQGGPAFEVLPPIPGHGYSSTCGCPPGSREDEDCLCNEDQKVPIPPTPPPVCSTGQCTKEKTLVLLPIFTIEDAPPEKLYERARDIQEPLRSFVMQRYNNMSENDGRKYKEQAEELTEFFNQAQRQNFNHDAIELPAPLSSSGAFHTPTPEIAPVPAPVFSMKTPSYPEPPSPRKPPPPPPHLPRTTYITHPSHPSHPSHPLHIPQPRYPPPPLPPSRPRKPPPLQPRRPPPPKPRKPPPPQPRKPLPPKPRRPPPPPPPPITESIEVQYTMAPKTRYESKSRDKQDIRKIALQKSKSSIFTRVAQFKLPGRRSSSMQNKIVIKNVIPRKDFSNLQKVVNDYMNRSGYRRSNTGNNEIDQKHEQVTVAKETDHRGAETTTFIPETTRHTERSTETILNNAEEKVMNYNEYLKQKNNTVNNIKDIDIKDDNDNKLMSLLDTLEKEVKNIALDGSEKELFDAKIRKIYGSVVGKPELLTTQLPPQLPPLSEIIPEIDIGQPKVLRQNDLINEAYTIPTQNIKIIKLSENDDKISGIKNYDYPNQMIQTEKVYDNFDFKKLNENIDQNVFNNVDRMRNNNEIFKNKYNENKFRGMEHKYVDNIDRTYNENLDRKYSENTLDRKYESQRNYISNLDEKLRDNIDRKYEDNLQSVRIFKQNALSSAEDNIKYRNYDRISEKDLKPHGSPDKFTYHYKDGERKYRNRSEGKKNKNYHNKELHNDLNDPLSLERRKYYQEKLENIQRKLRGSRNFRRRNEGRNDRTMRKIRPNNREESIPRTRSQKADSFYMPERARFLHGF